MKKTTIGDIFNIFQVELIFKIEPGTPIAKISYACFYLFLEK